MKTTASSIELVSSRVRILLLVSFTCLAMAAWFGMTTGCGGGGGAATPDEPGDTPISAVPVVSFEDGAELSAKNLVLEFDEDMEGILTPEHFALTDASGNPISIEFDWITPRILRILAPLPYLGEYNLKMYSLAQSASLAAKAADDGLLFSVNFKTGPNTFQSGFSVGDVNGDGKADAIFHHVRVDASDADPLNWATVTKAELILDVAESDKSVDLSKRVGSWVLENGDIVDDGGKPLNEAAVGKPVAIVGDVTGDGKSDFVVASRWLEKKELPEEDEWHVDLGVYSDDGDGGFEMVAQLPMDREPYGVFGADLDGDGVDELVAWRPDLFDDKEGTGKIDLAAVNVKAAVERAGGKLPAILGMADITAGIMQVPAGEKPKFYVYGVSPVGDINGDRKDDIAISYRLDQFDPAAQVALPEPDLVEGIMPLIGAITYVGKVEIYLGGWDGVELMPGVFVADGPDITITGAERFGFAVAGGGDVNGYAEGKEPVDDLVIGAPGAVVQGAGVANEALLPSIAPDPAEVLEEPVVSPGKAYVFFGDTLKELLVTSDTAPSGLLLTSADADVDIEATDSLMTGFGRSVAIADVVAPAQFADIIVGEPSTSRAFVFAGCKPGAATRACPMEDGALAVSDAVLRVTSDEMGGGKGRNTDGTLKAEPVPLSPYKTGTVEFFDLGRALMSADFDNSGYADFVALGGANRVERVEKRYRDNDRRTVVCRAGTQLSELSSSYEGACVTDCNTSVCGEVGCGEDVEKIIALAECIVECKADNPYGACPAGFEEVDISADPAKPDLRCQAQTSGTVCASVIEDKATSSLNFSETEVLVTGDYYKSTFTPVTKGDEGAKDVNSMYACVQKGGSEGALACGSDGWAFKDLYSELMDYQGYWAK